MHAQALLRPLARIALTWYYADVQVVGRERVPTTGPLFLAGNHPNALVDALVIGTAVPRPLSIVAKATLFANPLAARVLRALGVLPVRRVSDEGRGDARGETHTEGRGDATATAPDPARNAATFAAISDALARGGAVLIFPEGKSHDDPSIAPLRSGIARMALTARDDRDVRGTVIVPVGLVFEAKEIPRTRVLVQCGAPLDVDAFVHALPTGADAAALLMAEVERRLRAVTLNFATAEDAHAVTTLAGTLATLLAPTGRVSDVVPLRDIVRLVQRVQRAQAALDARGDAALAERAAAFLARVQAFRERLAREDIALEDVGIDAGAAPGARFAVREGVRALWMGPVGLWGRVNHWLPLRLARALALRGVRSRDEPAMRTVVNGLGLVLAFYAVQTVAVAWLAGPWWAAAYACTLVPSASSDLRYGDRARRARQRARTWRRFRAEPALQRSLRAEADALRGEAGELERSLAM